MVIAQPDSASDGMQAEWDVLAERLFASRKRSETLVQPLSPEDQVVQAMDDASPAKWHLAHTTWFYESFVLRQHLPGYKPFSEDFEYCFNSYYESKGDRHPRASRGLLTRPSATEVSNYRAHVDGALLTLFDRAVPGTEAASSIARLLEVGINHEQQHQELLLTDVLALFARQPLHPAYSTSVAEWSETRPQSQDRPHWLSLPGGVCEIGHAGSGFCYDNEGPRHHVLLHPFRLADRLVTNKEWLAFMDDGGYTNPLLWLADGWTTVQTEGWTSPEYWQRKDGAWHQMSLKGLRPLNPAAPVCHVSYYEADAFARWAGKRLPTEFEWEFASKTAEQGGNLLDSGHLRPMPPQGPPAGGNEAKPQQMFGDVWEWTQSAYQPYPGYKPAEGAIGEYNGKFMCSQQVLRGASCVTAEGHSRSTYRNFFYPRQRWQFMGLRLADDAR